jgi:hypothetical protein
MFSVYVYLVLCDLLFVGFILPEHLNQEFNHLKAEN